MLVEAGRRGPRKRLIQPVKVSTQLEKSVRDRLAAYCEAHNIPLTEGFARAIERLVGSNDGRSVALAGEAALGKVWDTAEEDEAWQHL